MVRVMLFVMTSQQRYIVRVYSAHTLHDMQILQTPQQRSDHIQGSESPATAEKNHADRMPNKRVRDSGVNCLMTTGSLGLREDHTF